MARKTATETCTAPAPVAKPAPAAPPKTGLALFNERYANQERDTDGRLKFPGEYQRLLWKRPDAQQVVLACPEGVLHWPDGSEAVFPVAEGREILVFLKRLRPRDGIYLQPATT